MATGSLRIPCHPPSRCDPSDTPHRHITFPSVTHTIRHHPPLPSGPGCHPTTLGPFLPSAGKEVSIIVVTRSLRVGLTLALCCLTLVAAPAAADPPGTGVRSYVAHGERPSPHYPSILYAEIAPTLTALAGTSLRLRVEQLGRSAGGLPLLLATVSSPRNLARLEDLQAQRRAMIEGDATGDEDFGDLPAIVMLNAGWQGNAYAGVDAALALVRRLSEDTSEATESILENVILLANVVPNPDGRVAGSLGNATDLEPARDLVAQSQPETRAVVDLLATWSPMVVLDVEGLESPMVIGVSPPPRPIPSADLYEAWSLDIAHAMSTAVHAASGHTPETMRLGSEIAVYGWPPLRLASYASYHGAYGLSLTVAGRDESGVVALEAALGGALAFVSEHRQALVRDQARLLADGLLRVGPPLRSGSSLVAGPQVLRADAAGAPVGPAAYLIPTDAVCQQDRHEAAALVNHLLANGVRVERTHTELVVRSKPYAPGAYLVRMDQPRGALAAALLWAPSVDDRFHARAGSGWSLPLAWGVTCVPIEHLAEAETETVLAAHPPRGSVERGATAGYAYSASTNAAIVATNALLAENVPLHWAPSPLRACTRELPAGAFYLPSRGEDSANAAERLAAEYGLDVAAVCMPPPSVAPLRPQRLGVHSDPGVSFALRGLGFDVTAITACELDRGHNLAQYDALIVSGQAPLWVRLSARGKRSLQEAQAIGSIIAIGAAGADVALATRIADIDATVTSHHVAAMAAITCDRDDPVTASYPEHTVLFALAPTWYTYLPEGASAVAHLSSAGPLLTGYWPVCEDINPAGEPIIVHVPRQEGNLTLFGIDPTYGAFGRHGFRLLAQAIYRHGTLGSTQVD